MMVVLLCLVGIRIYGLGFGIAQKAIAEGHDVHTKSSWHSVIATLLSLIEITVMLYVAFRWRPR